MNGNYGIIIILSIEFMKINNNSLFIFWGGNGLHAFVHNWHWLCIKILVWDKASYLVQYIFFRSAPLGCFSSTSNKSDMLCKTNVYYY
jgi:hypothetical protein